MESKIYLTLSILSILVFALIALEGISTTIFVNVFAQEGAITPEGAVNDTMSGQNASQWATNATLAFAQGESKDTDGMTENGDKEVMEDFRNETGMTEGETDPNGEGEVDLGTGGP